MRTERRRHAPALLLAAAAVLAAGVAAHAQQIQSSRSTPTRDLSGSERDLSALEKEAGAKQRAPRDVMAEINEDFGRLRAINDGFHQASPAAAAGAPDYKDISLKSAEVKKRAAR